LPFLKPRLVVGEVEEEDIFRETAGPPVCGAAAPSREPPALGGRGRDDALRPVPEGGGRTYLSKSVMVTGRPPTVSRKSSFRRSETGFPFLSVHNTWTSLRVTVTSWASGFWSGGETWPPIRLCEAAPHTDRTVPRPAAGAGAFHRSPPLILSHLWSDATKGCNRFPGPKRPARAGAGKNRLRSRFKP